MPDRLEIIPVHGIGEVRPGTDLAEEIATAAPWLRDGDVLVVTSKIVSKAEGRVVDVPETGPEREAAREELLAAETARPVARRGRTRIVRTHHGFVLASAGIDASNVERSRLVLLPKDPDASARGLRLAVRERTGRNVAVIVSDTMGRPWRNALTDVALGAAGLDAVRDYRGETDAYGNELYITQMAVADELAGAADLVKGKRERVPVAVVRGFLSAPPMDDGDGATVLLREPEQDLFPLGTAEAHAAGLIHAAELDDASTFGEIADATALLEASVDSEVAAVISSAVERALAHIAAAAAPSTLLTPSPIDGGELDVPARTTHLIRCAVADPRALSHLFALGVDVHRLRCALAAAGLATRWRAATDERAATDATDTASGTVGFLAIGVLPGGGAVAAGQP
jgi:coenzyme F420-0:L-glutamate ligase/coenzyme F420-1:gamma-L-glutamate ligase